MAEPLPSFCPRFHRAVELVGRRWTGAIIRALLPGPARFNALRDTIPDISDRMLSERLHELEAEGVVLRRVVPETPVRVEYELTEKGRALEDVIRAMATWAESWVERPAREGSGGRRTAPAESGKPRAEPRPRRDKSAPNR